MAWTKQELTELGQICLENNIIVVSDEIHSDLVYPEYQHVPFANISDEFAQICITATAASKTFNMAGLSSAYIITANEQYLLAYKKHMRATHVSSGNFFGIVATEAAFNHGDEWLLQLKNYLKGNRDFMEEFLANEVPNVKMMHPEATFLAWIDLSELPVSANQAFSDLVKAGVGLSIGNMFGPGGENFVRLNFGCPRSVLKQGLDIIRKTWG